MTRDTRTMVIVGTGMAGTRAAARLREEGFEGRVVLLGRDLADPYDHVPLSKNHLTGAAGYHELYLNPPGFYAEHDIERRPGVAVASVDPAAHTVTLDGGDTLDYDTLLLATGSRTRRLAVPGADLPGVFAPRTLAEFDGLRRALAGARRLVVVGAGFVGSEIAASARELGLDVTLVSRGPLPMGRALGTVGGAFYRDLHEAHGVRVHAGVTAVASHGDGAGRDGSRGGVREVELSDGTVLPADVVVTGVGADPEVDLARAAGLPIGDGVEVDETLRAAPGVYAAGDVASVPDPRRGGRTRVAHYATARKQGVHAARNMLGADRPYRAVPFFFTDQFGVWMEYTGDSDPQADTVVRGTVGAGPFVVFHVRGDRLVAAMNVDVHGIPDLVTPVIARGIPVDRAALADPDFDLATLAR